MVLGVLYFDHDASSGIGFWGLMLTSTCGVEWGAMPILYFWNKVGFFWRVLLIVRGSLPSVGNMWVLLIALFFGYVFTVRCWFGCWLLTADTRYLQVLYLVCLFSMGSARFGRCCECTMQTIFNGAWCRLLQNEVGFLGRASWLFVGHCLPLKLCGF